jgi:hypothetical protein
VAQDERRETFAIFSARSGNEKKPLKNNYLAALTAPKKRMFHGEAGSRDVTQEPLPESALPLKRCQELFAQRIGPLAPSYPTLKRWAAAGKLETARAPKGEGASRYLPRKLAHLMLSDDPVRYAALREAISPRARERRGHAKPHASPHLNDEPTSVSAAQSMQVADAARALAEIVPQLIQATTALTELSRSIVTRLERVEAGVANLEATRRMLMMKADAETTAWRRRAELAEQQLAESRQQASPVDSLRVSRLLSQIEEHLASSGQRR